MRGVAGIVASMIVRRAPRRVATGAVVVALAGALAGVAGGDAVVAFTPPQLVITVLPKD